MVAVQDRNHRPIGRKGERSMLSLLTTYRRGAAALLIFTLVVGLMLPGCASRSGTTYSNADVRQAQRVQFGTVVDTQEVVVEEDPTLLGPAIGGVAGGVLGNLIGSGSGRVLATVGGAALGALGGAATEFGLRRYDATQITVQLEEGGTIAVVQQRGEFFGKGDRVRVLTTPQGRARVQRV